MADNTNLTKSEKLKIANEERKFRIDQTKLFSSLLETNNELVEQTNDLVDSDEKSRTAFHKDIETFKRTSASLLVNRLTKGLKDSQKESVKTFASFMKRKPAETKDFLRTDDDELVDQVKRTNFLLESILEQNPDEKKSGGLFKNLMSLFGPAGLAMTAFSLLKDAALGLFALVKPGVGLLVKGAAEFLKFAAGGLTKLFTNPAVLAALKGVGVAAAGVAAAGITTKLIESGALGRDMQMGVGLGDLYEAIKNGTSVSEENLKRINKTLSKEQDEALTVGLTKQKLNRVELSSELNTASKMSFGSRDVNKLFGSQKKAFEELRDAGLMDISTWGADEVTVKQLGIESKELKELTKEEVSLIFKLAQLRREHGEVGIEILRNQVEKTKDELNQKDEMRTKAKNIKTERDLISILSPSATDMISKDATTENYEHNLKIPSDSKVDSVVVKDGVDLSGVNLGSKHSQMERILLDSYQSVVGDDYQPVITSGKRTAKENEMVSGNSASKHLTGQAIDLRTNDLTEAQGDAIASKLKSKLGSKYFVMQHGSGSNRHIHLQSNESGDPLSAQQKPVDIQSVNMKSGNTEQQKMKAMMDFLAQEFAPIMAEKLAISMNRVKGGSMSYSPTPNPFG